MPGDCDHRHGVRFCPHNSSDQVSCTRPRGSDAYPDFTGAPGIAVGSVSGLWILKAIPQRAFEWVVLVLIAASAMNLLIG